MFSNKFPYSFYGNKMPLPASPGPFSGGAQSRVCLLALLPLGSAVAGSSTEHVT